MRKFLTLFLLVFAIYTCPDLQAQKITISGRVTDSITSQTLGGTSIRNKTSKTGTMARRDGTFSISAEADDVLLVSHTGYKTKEIALDGRTTLDVFLLPVLIEIDPVVTVGTRGSGRVKTQTPVPVDVITLATAMPTGRMDVTSVLNYVAPSFNYNKQSGSDGADHVDLATLRGLGPDQTLVLINGKRRHQTSFVSVFGTRGRGNSGTDLNAIPTSSIDRIEILRDAASAQYGSDAIAGVINIVLKKNVNKLTGNVGFSAFHDPKFNTAFENGLGHYEYDDKLDGKTFTAGLNYGFPLGNKGGFFNISADFLTNGKTFRQVLDTTSDPVANPDKMVLNPYRRANGDASLDMGGTMFNAEIPFANQTTSFYSFGGFNYKKSDAFAFTRNFSARPDRFPTDVSGNLIDVPGIIKTTADGEQYYNPHIQTKIHDVSWAAGVKGQNQKGWNWDLSNVIGYNRFHFFGDQTFNASLGANQTDFDDGGFTFLQNTANFTLSRQLPNIAKGMNLAFGLEHRYEKYTIFTGEEASYKNYDPTGEKASGAQGFPGYQPADEVDADRTEIAAYIDAEIDVTDHWLIGGAIRVENYSDFGFTDNYKLATRLKVSDKFNIRGSGSTGFRAPSLQQINFSSTFTTVQGSTVAEVKIAPNYSPITQAAGIPELKQERSVTASLGFTYSPIQAFNIAIDGYWVRIKDRVVLSGQFDGSDPDIDPTLATQMAALNVSYAQFFANAVNTINKGVDIVMDYSWRTGFHRYKFLFAGNLQDMELDQINVPAKLSGSDFLRQTFLSDREQAFILASAPRSKMSLNLEYGYNKLTIGTRFTRFGEVKLLGYGEDALGIDPKVPTDANPDVYVRDEYVYKSKVVSDLYGSYRFNDHWTLFLGADNVFNVHPSLGVAPGARWWAYNNEPAGPWDAVQMGGNGRRFFTRLAFEF